MEYGKPSNNYMPSAKQAVSVWTFLDQASVFNSTHTSVKTSAFPVLGCFSRFKNPSISGKRGSAKGDV